MSPANPYIDLLARFQEAYATHGSYHLWFAAVTHEELNAFPSLREALVTAVPLPDSGWYLVAEIVHASRFYAIEEYCELRSQTMEAFRQLASRAGAALPLSIRKSIAGSPADTPAGALSWWVTFLWHVFPPSDEKLTPREGQEPPVRIAFSDPFQASIDAIELCKLDTVQPQYPPREATALPAPATNKGRMTVK